MAKKNKQKNLTNSQNVTSSEFYFGKKNYRWMLVGLVMILLGFALMLGPDANTVNRTYDPNVWNDGVFSVLRIRIAPLLVIAGFVVEAYAILKINKS